MSTNDTILSYHESLLRQSDVNLLTGPHWLNDQIISFYLEYLEYEKFKEQKETVLFIGPEVTQCIKIVTEPEIPIFLEPLQANEKSFIFFPLNNHELALIAGGSHWSLLVFSRLENSFYCFDSAKSYNSETCADFVSKIKKSLNCPDGIVKHMKCPQQNNGYDCGVHVLWLIETIGQHVIDAKQVANFDVTTIGSNVIRDKRTEILNVIRKLGGKC